MSTRLIDNLQKLKILFVSAGNWLQDTIWNLFNITSTDYPYLSRILPLIIIMFIVQILIITCLIRRCSIKNSALKKGATAKDDSKEDWEIISINKQYSDSRDKLQNKLVTKVSVQPEIKQKHNLFLLEFNGDVKASAALGLAEQITAILQVAHKKDEVLVKITSGGGYVSSYGFAATQLERLRNANINLTVAVDEIAASGGYMMAVVANKIIASPFAIIGSIGVIAELINVNKFLKQYGIEVESHTAGKFKRTLTTYGENTEEGRQEFKKELENTHELFKNHITKYRNINMDEAATGKYWFAQEAITLNLIDQISTSDDYIYQKYIAGIHNILYLKTIKKSSGLQSGAKTLLDNLNYFIKNSFSVGNIY